MGVRQDGGVVQGDAGQKGGDIYLAMMLAVVVVVLFLLLFFSIHLRAIGGRRDVMSSDAKRWRVTCTPQQFEALRQNEEFHCILKLARAVNCLRFGQVALVVDSREADTPSANRQRMSSFLYSGALLFEAFKFTNTLGEYFKERGSFRDGFAKLLGDSNVKKLRDGLLDKLRNEIAFHFLPNVIPESLKTLQLNEYVFLSGEGPQNKGAYYDLADATMVHYLVDAPSDGKDFEKRFEKVVKRITDAIVRFCDSAEMLITDVVGNLGFQMEEEPNRKTSGYA